MVKEGYTREVIPAARFNENLEESTRKEAYASKKTIAIAALIPVAVSLPLIYKRMTESYSTTTIPVSSTVTSPIVTPPLSTPTHEAFNSMATAIPTGQPEVLAQPVGVIADTSLEMLATILDPLVQIMVAISFPIASVIMVGSCFFFMFGDSDKAWSGIMKAGLGYVIIQMSPLFLQILRQVGEAV